MSLAGFSDELQALADAARVITLDRGLWPAATRPGNSGSACAAWIVVRITC